MPYGMDDGRERERERPRKLGLGCRVNQTTGSTPRGGPVRASQGRGGGGGHGFGAERAKGLGGVSQVGRRPEVDGEPETAKKESKRWKRKQDGLRNESFEIRDRSPPPAPLPASPKGDPDYGSVGISSTNNHTRSRDAPYPQALAERQRRTRAEPAPWTYEADHIALGAGRGQVFPPSFHTYTRAGDRQPH
ncbi:hypothetical protein LX36DRAFT_462623 [Colletotrichum falcatum]|nr:hypothetical protein LX36DRAFT_462623 [Colletotrichum falcatum]